jgi:glutamine synthetase
LVAVVQAVYDHSDLLVSSVATIGNESRLGGHEAPPSIISVFLGHFLDKTLNFIENNSVVDKDFEMKVLSNFKKIPNFLMDNTDRNRTSPFAFTGNKFEFRAVGSSQNVATPITILNTIVADSIEKITNTIKDYMKTENFELAVLKTIKDVIVRTKNIRFEKDGYSKDWHKEAENRGLYINNVLFSSLKELVEKKNIELFKKYDIFSENELKSRYLAWTELYISNKTIGINVLLELLENKIIPDVIAYRGFLIENLKSAKGLVEGTLLKNEKKLLKDYSRLISELFEKRDNLNANKKVLKKKKDLNEAVLYIHNSIDHIIEDIKEIVDKLEKNTGDKYWSLLKYKDFLFY